jgi:hypothetical protein
MTDMLHQERHSANRSIARFSAQAAVEQRGAKPLREGGWLESSWDLSHGLEISDLQGELPEEFVRLQPESRG